MAARDTAAPDGLWCGATARRRDGAHRVTDKYKCLEAIGRRVESQALAQKDSHRYDIMATTDAAGGEKSFWFLIDDVFAREQEALRPPSRPPR